VSGGSPKAAGVSGGYRPARPGGCWLRPARTPRRAGRGTGRPGRWPATWGSARTPLRRCGVTNGLKPWKVDTFKISTDPHLEEKLVDVVGLYLDPPARAAVFSFDEKTQYQALDRTQPSLPMKRGRGAT
jgi:hypothetical protein